MVGRRISVFGELDKIWDVVVHHVRYADFFGIVDQLRLRPDVHTRLAAAV
jgi:hypothetical protein